MLPGGDSWFPLHVVGALRHAIEAERQAPYRKDVIKTSLEVRATRKFDEENALQVGLFDEPNFDDRYSRTPERVRKRADHILKTHRRQRPGKHGRGSGRYFVRPDGIGAATQCALMIAISKRKRPVRNYGQRQAAMFSGAAAHQIAPRKTVFGDFICGKRRNGVTPQSRVAFSRICKLLLALMF